MSQPSAPILPEPTPVPIAALGPPAGGSLLKRLGWPFFALNTIEMWERLAYFGVRTVVPLYIMQANDPGGLHLTAADKGSIYAWWALVQSVLPMVTGGFADRYGYKKTMAVSVTLNIIGYLMMAWLRSYWGFFAGVMVLATGTALFKPSIQGSLAQNLDKEVSSVGWGIFYMVVNIGGFAGPFVATAVLGAHTAEDWRNVFLLSAGFTALNYFMMFTFRDVPSGASKTESPLQVLSRTIRNVFEPRLVAWLLIMSGFWLMMYQLWDLHPNFIADWVDSGPAASVLVDTPLLGGILTEQTDRGLQVPQALLLNLNALLVIVLMLPISWAVRRLRTLSAMLMGMVLAIGGIVVGGLTGSAWVLMVGILFFSLGEMLTGPKKNEYLALIAPPGKKGLYLGYVNIPVGLGVGIGSKLAGWIYGNYGEKAVLSQKYLLDHSPLGADVTWDGSVETLDAALGVSRSEAFSVLQQVEKLDPVQATQLLWDTYDPQLWVWLPFAAIGVVSAVALGIFGRMARRWADMDA